MLPAALKEPDPVFIFEHAMLYPMEGDLDQSQDPAKGPADISKAAVRKEGSDISLITYGGSLFKTLDAADILSKDGIRAEVIDVRSLAPLVYCGRREMLDASTPAAAAGNFDDRESWRRSTRRRSCARKRLPDGQMHV